MTLHTLSKTYGWTTEYILTRTTREIAEHLKCIFKDKYEEMKFDASLSGFTLPEPKEISDNEAHEPIDPKRFDEALKKVKERKGLK